MILLPFFSDFNKGGKRMAEERHAFMMDSLDRFYTEWEGKESFR